MKLCVHDIRPRARAKDLHLLLTPSQKPRQRRQSKRLQRLRRVFLAEQTDLLHVFILRPCVDGPLEHGFLHVDEACRQHAFFVL